MSAWQLTPADLEAWSATAAKAPKVDVDDPTLDHAGPVIHLTWRQYGELIRLLDRALEWEDEGGWSTKALRDMANLLVQQARSSSAASAA